MPGTTIDGAAATTIIINKSASRHYRQESYEDEFQQVTRAINTYDPTRGENQDAQTRFAELIGLLANPKELDKRCRHNFYSINHLYGLFAINFDAENEQHRELLYFVLEKYHSHFNQSFSSSLDHVTGAVIVAAEVNSTFKEKYKDTYKSIDWTWGKNKNSENSVAKRSAEFHLTLKRLFENQQTCLSFFQHCPTAVLELSPTNLIGLARKHKAVAKYILENSALRKIVEKVRIGIYEIYDAHRESMEFAEQSIIPRIGNNHNENEDNNHGLTNRAESQAVKTLQQKISENKNDIDALIAPMSAIRSFLALNASLQGAESKKTKLEGQDNRTPEKMRVLQQLNGVINQYRGVINQAAQQLQSNKQSVLAVVYRLVEKNNQNNDLECLQTLFGNENVQITSELSDKIEVANNLLIRERDGFIVRLHQINIHRLKTFDETVDDIEERKKTLRFFIEPGQGIESEEQCWENIHYLIKLDGKYKTLIDETHIKAFFALADNDAKFTNVLEYLLKHARTQLVDSEVLKQAATAEKNENIDVTNIQARCVENIRKAVYENHALSRFEGKYNTGIVSGDQEVFKQLYANDNSKLADLLSAKWPGSNKFYIEKPVEFLKKQTDWLKEGYHTATYDDIGKNLLRIIPVLADRCHSKSEVKEFKKFLYKDKAWFVKRRLIDCLRSKVLDIIENYSGATDEEKSILKNALSVNKFRGWLQLDEKLNRAVSKVIKNSDYDLEICQIVANDSGLMGQISCIQEAGREAPRYNAKYEVLFFDETIRGAENIYLKAAAEIQRGIKREDNWTYNGRKQRYFASVRSGNAIPPEVNLIARRVDESPCLLNQAVCALIVKNDRYWKHVLPPTRGRIFARSADSINQDKETLANQSPFFKVALENENKPEEEKITLLDLALNPGDYNFTKFLTDQYNGTQALLDQVLLDLRAIKDEIIKLNKLLDLAEKYTELKINSHQQLKTFIENSLADVLVAANNEVDSTNVDKLIAKAGVEENQKAFVWNILLKEDNVVNFIAAQRQVQFQNIPSDRLNASTLYYLLSENKIQDSQVLVNKQLELLRLQQAEGDFINAHQQLFIPLVNNGQLNQADFQKLWNAVSGHTEAYLRGQTQQLPLFVALQQGLADTNNAAQLNSMLQAPNVSVDFLKVFKAGLKSLLEAKGNGLQAYLSVAPEFIEKIIRVADEGLDGLVLGAFLENGKKFKDDVDIAIKSKLLASQYFPWDELEDINDFVGLLHADSTAAIALRKHINVDGLSKLLAMSDQGNQQIIATKLWEDNRSLVTAFLAKQTQQAVNDAIYLFKPMVAAGAHVNLTREQLVKLFEVTTREIHPAIKAEFEQQLANNPSPVNALLLKTARFVVDVSGSLNKVDNGGSLSKVHLPVSWIQKLFAKPARLSAEAVINLLKSFEINQMRYKALKDDVLGVVREQQSALLLNVFSLSKGDKSFRNLSGHIAEKTYQPGGIVTLLSKQGFELKSYLESTEQQDKFLQACVAALQYSYEVSGNAKTMHQSLSKAIVTFFANKPEYLTQVISSYKTENICQEALKHKYQAKKLAAIPQLLGNMDIQSYLIQVDQESLCKLLKIHPQASSTILDVSSNDLTLAERFIQNSQPSFLRRMENQVEGWFNAHKDKISEKCLQKLACIGSDKINKVVFGDVNSTVKVLSCAVVKANPQEFNKFLVSEVKKVSPVRRTHSVQTKKTGGGSEISMLDELKRRQSQRGIVGSNNHDVNSKTKTATSEQKIAFVKALKQAPAKILELILSGNAAIIKNVMANGGLKQAFLGKLEVADLKDLIAVNNPAIKNQYTVIGQNCPQAVNAFLSQATVEKVKENIQLFLPLLAQSPEKFAEADIVKFLDIDNEAVKQFLAKAYEWGHQSLVETEFNQLGAQNSQEGAEGIVKNWGFYQPYLDSLVSSNKLIATTLDMFLTYNGGINESLTEPCKQWLGSLFGRNQKLVSDYANKASVQQLKEQVCLFVPYVQKLSLAQIDETLFEKILSAKHNQYDEIFASQLGNNKNQQGYISAVMPKLVSILASEQTKTDVLASNPKTFGWLLGNIKLSYTDSDNPFDQKFNQLSQDFINNIKKFFNQNHELHDAFDAGFKALIQNNSALMPYLIDQCSSTNESQTGLSSAFIKNMLMNNIDTILAMLGDNQLQNRLSKDQLKVLWDLEVEDIKVEILKHDKLCANVMAAVNWSEPKNQLAALKAIASGEGCKELSKHGRSMNYQHGESPLEKAHILAANMLANIDKEDRSLIMGCFSNVKFTLRLFPTLEKAEAKVIAENGDSKVCYALVRHYLDATFFNSTYNSKMLQEVASKNKHFKNAILKLELTSNIHDNPTNQKKEDLIKLIFMNGKSDEQKQEQLITLLTHPDKSIREAAFDKRNLLGYNELEKAFIGRVDNDPNKYDMLFKTGPLLAFIFDEKERIEEFGIIPSDLNRLVGNKEDAFWKSLQGVNFFTDMLTNRFNFYAENQDYQKLTSWVQNPNIVSVLTKNSTSLVNALKTALGEKEDITSAKAFVNVFVENVNKDQLNNLSSLKAVAQQCHFASQGLKNYVGVENNKNLLNHYPGTTFGSPDSPKSSDDNGMSFERHFGK